MFESNIYFENIHSKRKVLSFDCCEKKNCMETPLFPMEQNIIFSESMLKGGMEENESMP
jgi:hypothetical protein